MTTSHRVAGAFLTLVCGAAIADAQPADAPPAEADVAAPWELPPQLVEHPQVFQAPTARLIPAAVLYTGGGIDSDGVPWAGATLGLGDVAEFGVATTDIVRARAAGPGSPADSILPYVTATFRMGVPEDLVFRHQPAVVLGFRKSFTRDEQDMRTRVAELFMVASKRLGRAQLHLGGTVWDGSLQPLAGGDPVTTITLHEAGLGAQVRGIFGADIEVKPHAYIMVESFWAPEFGYADQSIDLAARFAFGVRWQPAAWLALESGVALPDIGDGDLLQAKIFGQVRLINQTFARAYRRSK